MWRMLADLNDDVLKSCKMKERSDESVMTKAARGQCDLAEKGMWNKRHQNNKKGLHSGS